MLKSSFQDAFRKNALSKLPEIPACCRLAVLASGGGTNLQAIIDGIASRKITNAELAVVITSKPDAHALERASASGIEGICIAPREYASRDMFESAMLEALGARKIDLIVLAGYLVVLPRQIVNAYHTRIINVHPSLIPSFCGTGFYGLRVHEAALERGVRITGATVHFVDEGTDTGPIILQKAVRVEPEDTPERLQKRVMEEAEWKILPLAIHLIANGRVKIKGSLVSFTNDN